MYILHVYDILISKRKKRTYFSRTANLFRNHNKKVVKMKYYKTKFGSCYINAKNKNRQ